MPETSSSVGLDVVSSRIQQNIHEHTRAQTHPMNARKAPRGLPLWVTLTYAQSLDGSISDDPSSSASKRSPLQLSSPESMKMTHGLRSVHDLILVGVGTVLSDDPSLTTRLVPGPHPRPVVLDSRGRCPLSSKLFTARGADALGPIIIAGSSRYKCVGERRSKRSKTSEEDDDEAVEKRLAALKAAGALIVRAPMLDGRVDVFEALKMLGLMGFGSVMIEGGSGVISSVLRAKAYNVCVLTVAPTYVLGGLSAANNKESRESAAPEQQLLKYHQVVQLGADVVLVVYPV